MNIYTYTDISVLVVRESLTMSQDTEWIFQSWNSFFFLLKVQFLPTWGDLNQSIFKWKNENVEMHVKSRQNNESTKKIWTKNGAIATMRSSHKQNTSTLKIKIKHKSGVYFTTMQSTAV